MLGDVLSSVYICEQNGHTLHVCIYIQNIGEKFLT